MSLSAGARLGPYEITGLLGAGGMGEVYRARDTRLDRSVAIKVLPPDLSGDPDRRTRFEREARALASLAHPRICTLFDVGQHEGATYLVMEHLDGETLAGKLERGPLPLTQALAIAVEIAEGLDAAHKRGIVHRDLKPGNVMLTRTGARLLDFGLAKLRGHGETPALVMAGYASTRAESLTGPGTIMGTLAYMAPEQVQGNEADARADLWALGTIVYEMVAGVQPFTGDTAASVMGAILERDPAPLAADKKIAPESLDRVVRRCLAKNADERWESARDLADALRWIAQDLARGAPEGAAAAARPRWRRALPVAAGTAAGLLLGAGSLWLARPAARPAPQPVIRALLDVRPADEVRVAVADRTATRTPGGRSTAFVWTPDARALVFVGIKGGTQQLFVRSLGGNEAQPLAGTEGAQALAVSADGKWVAFWSKRAIRRVPLDGGPPTVMVDTVFRPAGMDWGASGLLVFDGAGGAIWRVRPGGEPEEVTKRGEDELLHLCPRLLPGDEVVLFTVRRREYTWGDEEVVAQSLASGKRTVLLRNAADARYMHPGRLLFMRQGTLLAVAFDPGTLEVKGEQVTLLDTVAQALTSTISGDITGAGQLAVSSAGALAYITTAVVPFADERLVTVDRNGKVEPLPAPSRSFYGSVDLSPDGRRLAVPVHTLDDAGLWIHDLVRGTTERLTPHGGEANYARWTPDGRRIAFDWLQSGVRVLASLQADGSAPLEILSRESAYPSSWTPDGRELVVRASADNRIGVLDVGVSPPHPRPWAELPVQGLWPVLSPDGRWLAYASAPSGRIEVYLQPYPGPGPRIQVSVDGGRCPAWNPNGRELFFLAPVDPLEVRLRMMSVDVALGTTAALGTPRQLFEFRDADVNLQCWPVNCYVVARDGQRFLTTDVVKCDPAPPVTQINLVLNWRAELDAKVPSPAISDFVPSSAIRASASDAS